MLLKASPGQAPPSRARIYRSGQIRCYRFATLPTANGLRKIGRQSKLQLLAESSTPDRIMKALGGQNCAHEYKFHSFAVSAFMLAAGIFRPPKSVQTPPSLAKHLSKI